MANWNMPPRDNGIGKLSGCFDKKKLASQSERPTHTAMEPTLMLFLQAGKTGHCLNGRCFDTWCQIVTSILLKPEPTIIAHKSTFKRPQVFHVYTPRTTSKHTSDYFKAYPDNIMLWMTAFFLWWRYFHSNELVTPCSLMSTTEQLW